MSHAVILDVLRTPRGRGRAGKGALSGIHPQELFAGLLKALPARTGLSLEEVADVVVGCVSQSGDQGANLARNAVLTAGWPLSVSGTTLNRFCGSGLTAVNFAAMGAASGVLPLVVAGGGESMSRVPMGSDGGGIDGNNVNLQKRFVQVPQGISADTIATLEGFSRADVDAVALRSQQRAARAMEEGRFARSLVPVIDPVTSTEVLAKDEMPRPDTTPEALAKLDPAFVMLGGVKGPDGRTFDQVAKDAYPAANEIQHVHTAGNSSGIADGAAAVVLASESYAKAKGLRPRARIRAMATVGTEPILMLTGPAPASQKALALAGMKPSDVDLWEINEAFASVVLETVRRLGLDMEKVNPNGGAIALGHPLGATGAVLLGTAVDELERTGKGTAVVTMCIGGGQGIATVIERV